jgi:hypothetical protein
MTLIGSKGTGPKMSTFLSKVMITRWMAPGMNVRSPVAPRVEGVTQVILPLGEVYITSKALSENPKKK